MADQRLQYLEYGNKNAIDNVRKMVNFKLRCEIKEDVKFIWDNEKMWVPGKDSNPSLPSASRMLSTWNRKAGVWIVTGDSMFSLSHTYNKWI